MNSVSPCHRSPELETRDVCMAQLLLYPQTYAAYQSLIRWQELIAFNTLKASLFQAWTVCTSLLQLANDSCAAQHEIYLDAVKVWIPL